MTDERRKHPRPEPFTGSFATFERARGLVEVRCRCCNVVIGKLLPVGQAVVRRVKDQTFVDTQLAFCHLANYREVEVEMENGGRHIGNACADCAPTLDDPTKLARFYETDLAQFRAEGHADIPLLIRAAKPMRVKRIETQIKD